MIVISELGFFIVINIKKKKEILIIKFYEFIINLS
jgi:hypothetical protein